MKPIKTNGDNPRQKNKSVAEETYDILKGKSYISVNGKYVDLTADMANMVSGTKYYPDPVTIDDQPIIDPKIEVENETTTAAAVRLSKLNKMVALNFASARNPGGGWRHGAKAQEEDLARASGLYSSLKSKPMYYNTNILCEDTFYTDGIIYSPDVPFFRDEYGLLMDEPYYLSIISAPAPNLYAMENIDWSVVEQVLYDRMVKILRVAVLNGHRNIILGAWGCGAFQNDTTMIATTWLNALADVQHFDHVCFAVYDKSIDTETLNIFKKIMGKE